VNALVDNVIKTVTHNLLVGALLVIAILFAFLGNLRAGLVVEAFSRTRCQPCWCCRRSTQPSEARKSPK